MSDDFNLYEFPADHIGRKTYVHVEGHARSIPVMYTYRNSVGRNAILPEYGGGPYDGGNTSAYVISDLTPYRSPLDMSVVSSRSQHRDHMRQHGVIEVGTQPMGSMAARREEAAPMPRAGHDIARAIRGEIGRN